MILGELAALATASLWAVTSMLFAAAGRRVGSVAVNQIRLVVAVALLILLHLAVYGTPFPSITGMHLDSTWLLVASGLVGLLIGDAGYFRALVDLGPKLATLMMSTYPIIAATLAFFVLGEVLQPTAIAGIGIAMLGVVLALIGRRPAPGDETKPRLWPGLLFGLVGAAGQAIGILIAKEALNGPASETPVSGRFDTLSGTLIRMLAAMAAMWLLVAARPLWPASWRRARPSRLREALGNRQALTMISIGALVGPVIGVWLSLVAVVNTKVGIATTIMATIPILAIPQVWILYKQRPGPLEILGAITTVAGVAILVLT